MAGRLASERQSHQEVGHMSRSVEPIGQATRRETQSPWLGLLNGDSKPSSASSDDELDSPFPGDPRRSPATIPTGGPSSGEKT
jgi:hypothetical protein